MLNVETHAWDAGVDILNLTLGSEMFQIESVRLVRDSATGMGKGFGYINFESADSVETALVSIF